MASPLVLFLGTNHGAFAAASRLGLRVAVVDPSPPWTGMEAAWVQAELDAPPEQVLQAAQAACQGERPDAVLGFTEWTVVLAAYVRQTAGLSGIPLETAQLIQDKAAMKERVRAAGLPCTDWIPVDERTPAEALANALGLPLVIKPRGASGSRGTVVARDLDQVRAALRGGCLAERYVAGAEFSVECLLSNGRVLLRNVTEYYEKLWTNIVPAELPDPVLAAVDRLNASALAALGVFHGITHLELYLTPLGPVFGEVAARAPGGYIMELIRTACGFDPWEALLAIELGADLAPLPGPRCSAGVTLLHPGPGLVQQVLGLDRVRAMPGVVLAECRLFPGSTIGPRVRAGQDAGRIVAVGAKREEVAGRLIAAREALEIHIQRPRPG